MAADIATLSIRVDSTQVREADRSLSALNNTGSMVEDMLKRVAAGFTAFKAAEWVKDTALLAARYDTLGVAMEVVGKNAGYTATSMGWYQRALQNTGISAIEARNTLTMMAAAQIDLSKSSQLARIAQDAAVIGNLNSSEAFERMIQGIRSGQVEILRTIGINVNFEQGYQKLAKSLGKTAADLSEYEKMQSRTNQVVEYGKNIAGTYEAAMGTAGKQMKSMERYAQDLQVQLGEVFQPTLKVIVDELTESLKKSSEALESNKENAGKFGQAFAGAFKEFGGLKGLLGAVAGGNLMGTIRALRGAASYGQGEDPYGLKRTYADWNKAGMSDSEGLEGGDPYGAIAARKKADALAAAAKAAEEYAKVITPLNQALAMERTLLEQGERAAYARSLDMQKIKDADKAALLQKWDYNKALRDQAENEEWLAKLDKEIRQGERQRVNTVFGINQRDLEAEAAQMERALNVVYPYRQEIMSLGQAYEDLSAALENGTITQAQFTKGEEELLRKTQQTLPVMTETFGDLRDTIQDWSRSSTEAFLDLTFKGKAAFSDLITSMLRDLARLAVQRNVMEPLFGYLAGAISSYGSSSGPTTTANTTGFIDNAPVSSIQSGAKVATNINVTVNTGKGEVDTQGQSGTELGRKLDAAVKAVLLNEMRAGGLLARA